MARAMVTRLGMSNEMGTMTYGQKEEMIFLGREISEQRDYSEAVAEQIDAEVRKMVDDAYKLTRKLLTKYRKQLGRGGAKTPRSGNHHPRRVRRDLPAAVPARRAAHRRLLRCSYR